MIRGDGAVMGCKWACFGGILDSVYSSDLSGFSSKIENRTKI